MGRLEETLRPFVDSGAVPGAVGLVARADEVEVAPVGSMSVGGPPMARDSIFRIASLTKPIAAAAVMTLVQDGLVALDDPVGEWLPEIAAPSVVRTPSSPVEDVVPANRPITVADLLAFQAGYGFASDFSLPGVQALFDVQRDGRKPRSFPDPDTWMARLGRLPLLYQPGESWLYDTCSTIQGVLIARITGRPLPEVLAERIFEPLGMIDTAFHITAAQRDRFTTYYTNGPDGSLETADDPDGQWSTPPDFPLANGGLVGTVDDLLAFGRMLLAGGLGPDGRRVLAEESVRLMTTDHTTAAQREIGKLFLDGQGWGFGAAVDISAEQPWNVPGRYGWVGGTGTSAHIIPSTGTVAILLTQVAADSPLPQPWMPSFWTYSA